MTELSDQVEWPGVQVERPGIQEQEWLDLRGNGENKYFLMHWYPAASATSTEKIQPKAAIVFVHGFAEHVKRYDNVFRLFAQAGYEVGGFDQRGYGRTWYEAPDRDRAHGWTTWDEQLTDVAHMIRLVRSRLDAQWGKDKVPMFLFGHSMGGGISTAFFTREPGKGPAEDVKKMISGVMISAPWLDIHFPIPTWFSVPLMRGVLTLIPRFSFPLGPPSSTLSRDPVVCEGIRKDPLFDSYVYSRGLLDPLRGGPQIVAKDYQRWPEGLPLVAMHGTGDLVTKWSCTKELCDKLKAMGRPVTFRSFEGYYHELLHEPGDLKVDVANAYIAWLDEQVASKKASAP